MNKLTDEQLEQEVIYHLKGHRGKRNPMDRWEMIERIFGVGSSYPRNDTNPYDRRIRKAVERLRPSMLICDLGDGRGRFLAESYAEYIEFRTRYVASAIPIMQTASKMDEKAEELFRDEYLEWKRCKDQPSLFGMAGAQS